MGLSLTKTVSPTVEPVSLADLRSQCRIDHGLEDSLLEGFIAAARDYCETLTRRQCCDATWVMRLDEFPAWEILIPIVPLKSIASIVYANADDGAAMTLAASKYVADPYSTPGRIRPAYGESWPSTRCQTGAVIITFVAGHGSPADVPPTMRQAIKLLAAHMFEQREASSAVALNDIPFGVRALLAANETGDYL